MDRHQLANAALAASIGMSAEDTPLDLDNVSISRRVGSSKMPSFSRDPEAVELAAELASAAANKFSRPLNSLKAALCSFVPNKRG